MLNTFIQSIFTATGKDALSNDRNSSQYQNVCLGLIIVNVRHPLNLLIRGKGVPESVSIYINTWNYKDQKLVNLIFLWYNNYAPS